MNWTHLTTINGDELGYNWTESDCTKLGCIELIFGLKVPDITLATQIK